MKTLKLLTVIRQDIDPLSRAVWKSEVLYTACYEEGMKEAAFILLDKNKLILNDSAFEAIGAKVGDRFDVVYRQEGIKLIPCLVNRTALNQGGGKLLRKSHNISFSGDAHDRLAKYGMFFHLSHFDKENTIFDLVPEVKLPSSQGIIDAKVEGGSDFDIDNDVTEQEKYDAVIEEKEYTKEEDLDDIINKMFN